MQSNIHLFHSLTFGQLKSEFASDSPNNLKEVHLYPEIPTLSFILLDLYTYWTILFGPISCLNDATWRSFQLCLARCFLLKLWGSLFLRCDYPTLSFILLDLYTYWTSLIDLFSCLKAEKSSSFQPLSSEVLRANAATISFLILRLSNIKLRESEPWGVCYKIAL